MADARKDKRSLLSLKVRYKSATLEDFIERYSNDISRGGVFIKAKKPLAVGTLLKFEFILQDQSTLLHGVGRVVWRRDEGDAENPAGWGSSSSRWIPSHEPSSNALQKSERTPASSSMAKTEPPAKPRRPPIQGAFVKRIEPRSGM